MNIIKVSIFLAICISLLSSCNDDVQVQPIAQNGVDSTETSANLGFSMHDFPIKVGNWWSYKVVDAYYDTVDTLVVTVNSLVDTVGTKKYHCSLKLNNTVVDSGRIDIGADSMVYDGLTPLYSYFGDFKLTFPFNEGDSWYGFFLPDTVVAVSRTEEHIFNGVNYSPIYSVKRSFFAEAESYSLTQLIFLSPGVGVISQYIDLFDNGTVQKQNFTLIDYHLE